MKAILTGANGAVGSILKKFFEDGKVEVVAWNRKIVPIEDRNAIEKFFKTIQPDILFHLAIGSQSRRKPNESWLVNYDQRLLDKRVQIASLKKTLNPNFAIEMQNRDEKDDDFSEQKSSSILAAVCKDFFGEKNLNILCRIPFSIANFGLKEVAEGYFCKMDTA